MPAAVSSAPLPLTGERTVPGIEHENYWFRRHEAAYDHIVAQLREGRIQAHDALEAGCGEGYGAAMLNDVLPGRVFALDYDLATISHVRCRYPKVRALRGDLQRLPVSSGSLDLVVNLQVIEHLHDQPGFIAECARVLRKGGILVVSTPNRITFSPGRDTPLNPFHTRELSAAELHELLAPHFTVSAALGIHHGQGFLAQPDIVETLIETPVDQWSPALRDFVRGVAASDFQITQGGIDASLDLIFVATVRS